jgi:trehalose synthase-fused probable maltokinase
LADLAWAAVERAFAAVDRSSIAAARWFGGKGRPVDRVTPVEAFELTRGAVLGVAEVGEHGAPAGRYLFGLTRTGEGELGLAEAGEGAWRALAVAIAEGRTVPAVPRRAATAIGASGPVTAALVCRPASGLRGLVPGGAPEIAGVAERALGADQSNTSVVLGERLLLKAYRRLEDGLNPDLELNAWLAEEVRFGGVPALGGFAEIVSARGAATVALLQEFVADGLDAYEATAEQLAGWIGAPGEVTVEFATEVAVGMGELTAALHDALTAVPDAPGFEVREATRAELRRWRSDAQRQLQRALDVVGGDAGRELRAMAPVIAEQLSVFEATPAVPVVTRIHGDLHLGQVLLAPDGPQVVDFEGDPTRPIEERRQPASPLRDAASMLRSLDHVGRSARRRAERRPGRVAGHVGLDIDAWLRRARERFLEAYRGGVRESGAGIVVDEDLLRAWEFEKECREFVYAATWLPEWTWAPLEGMRGLVAEVRAS